MKIQKPKSATPSIPVINGIGFILRILLKTSPKLRKRLMNIGELANYQIWLEEKFGHINLRNSRERVWKDIDSKLVEKSVHGIELGVAWGYLTYFWITKSKTKILKWDAYDLFTGLPRAWRSSPVGAFSNNGETPNIPDERINWHVGFVEETIQSLEIPKNRNYSLLVFFDLDIYEPSLVAWEKIKPMLKVILNSGEFEFISANWISLALEIKSLDPAH
jgi:hypothetical protein